MKRKSLLYSLNEATTQDVRTGARLRKRRQRDRDDATMQSNPFSMILVVKNKMNGEILIIDKESYEPKYHEILISPEQLNQSTIAGILKDPKFVQTETSKRLFGDVGTDAASEKSDSRKSGAGSSRVSSSVGTNSPTSVAPAPKQEIPFTPQNLLSGPTIALGMMGGLNSKQLMKSGITPEQLDEYNSSQEIQDVSMKIARDIGFYFKNIIGRNIAEYIPSIIDGQMFNTTSFWQTMGGTDSVSKTELVFRHKCVVESMKDKICAQSMCNCIESGVVPSEQTITYSVKYGPSSITSGKLNNDSQTILYSTISTIDGMMNGQPDKYLMSQFNENEKAALKKLVEDIISIKKDCIEKLSEKFKRTNVGGNDKDKMESIDKLVDTTTKKIERIINSNILYKVLFLHEAVTGYAKFGRGSPAYAQGIIAVVPDTYNVAMEMTTLNFSRKLLEEETKFTINFKNQIDINPDEKSELEACKIRFGGKCPNVLNPQKYAIRKLVKSYLSEGNGFKHSALKYLMEQEEPQDAESEFLQTIENASGIMDLMNIFAIKPEQITISAIDLFYVTSVDTSAERNTINVNGKVFSIPVKMDPMPSTTSQSIIEKGSILTSLLERAARDYEEEYENYHGTAEQRSNRSKRVLARRKMEELGKVSKGDGKDVDHKDGNPQNNSMSNLRARSASANRADH